MRPSAGEPAATAPAPLAGRISTVNASTGLSTDYLNHFTEAIMVLEMATVMPDCVEDLRSWQPKTYREHFTASRFAERDAVLTSYDRASAATRHALDSVSETINSILVDTRDAFLRNPSAEQTQALTQQAMMGLRPLVARAAAIINGTHDNRQNAIDAMLTR